MIKHFWDSLEEKFGRTGRTGLLVGTVVILLATALVGTWLLRTDYQVLFGDLTPQDTSALAAELDRQKIPYTLSDQGDNTTSILVDKEQVYKTRIKLMGKEIPIHGTVGFELFNNSDFGMTEFAQKINYQRALQGELTRTILSLSEIRDARVLLALPEQGLFKQATHKPKASVTLTMKQDQRLRPEQVTGIQRLVAAAVPAVLSQDVTIVDQTGVALTRLGDVEAEASFGAGSSRLDLKKETEVYLLKKANAVLERALGLGQAMASVDVTLDMDRVQSSTDEILSPGNRADATPTGVIIRERDTTREPDAPLGSRTEGGSAAGGSSQSEIEYTVGHRIEQVISQPGSIRRIQVAVVVNRSLTPELQESLSSMVAASIGASTERGDSIVVHSIEGLNSASPETVAPATGASVTAPPQGPERIQATGALGGFGMVVLICTGAILLVGVLVWILRGRSRHGIPSGPLTEAQRQAALSQVQQWMHGRQDKPGSRSGA